MTVYLLFGLKFDNDPSMQSNFISKCKYVLTTFNHLKHVNVEKSSDHGAYLRSRKFEFLLHDLLQETIATETLKIRV